MCIIIASKFCGFKNNHYLCTRNSEMIDDRGVEQLVARQAHNLEVACSSPASATNNDIASCKNNELCRFFVLGCDKSAPKIRAHIILLCFYQFVFLMQTTVFSTRNQQ